MADEVSAEGRLIRLGAKPAAVTIDPTRVAVIVVDMQNDCASPGGMFDRIGIDIPIIQRAVGVDFPAKAGPFKEGPRVVPPPGLPAGSRGVIYAVGNNNDLMWYRHDGHADGSLRWTEPKKVGNGWNFKQVFSGSRGVIYGITDSGDLMWYRHDGYGDGSYRWAEPKMVGNGWVFKDIFTDEPGS